MSGFPTLLESSGDLVSTVISSVRGFINIFLSIVTLLT